MKKQIAGIAIFVGGVLSGACVLMLLSQSTTSKTVISQPAQSGCDSVCWSTPPLPEKINFAGEEVPLERWEVKEQLDREILFNYYWQNNILYMLKLANRHFSYIEATLKAHGIPEDFKYLCVAESNLLQVTSKAGATGFWQLMKGTAPEYNLEITSTVDERYNIVKSTEAACRYLKIAYERFGNWTAAAASYNCGMGGYSNHSGYQGSRNYYDLILPEETQRYMFRILAFKYLMGQADVLGFKVPAGELYPVLKTRTIQVNKSIPDLVSFAKAYNSDYKMLKWLNPWLRARSLNAKPGKTYEILLPAE